MEMKGLMGGFYRISEWIMRFSVTNILWMITSIPVIFLILSVLFSEEISIELIQSTLFLIAVISPFVLFPSTSAMFSLARKWIIGEEDAPLFKTFFINYKRNYVQSMLTGLMYSVLFVTLFINYQFYLSQDNLSQLLSSLFLAFMLITAVSVFNFFSLQSHLHMKTFALLKNAILITIGKPITSILIIVTNLCIVYISFSFFKGFLVVFFMGSIVAYMSFYHFHRMFQKIQDKQQEFEEKQQEEEAKQLESPPSETDARATSELDPSVVEAEDAAEQQDDATAQLEAQRAVEHAESEATVAETDGGDAGATDHTGANDDVDMDKTDDDSVDQADDTNAANTGHSDDRK